MGIKSLQALAWLMGLGTAIATSNLVWFGRLLWLRPSWKTITLAVCPLGFVIVSGVYCRLLQNILMGEGINRPIFYYLIAAGILLAQVTQAIAAVRMSYEED
jgi:hypothetical protein